MPANDHIGTRTVPDLLAERIERTPEKVALVFERHDGDVRQYTFAELGDLSARVAAGFAALGVREGDKVAMHLPNCPEFVITFFALARLGAVGVPSNLANRAKEMVHVLGWSDARILITTADHLPLFDKVLPETPGIERVVVAGADPAPAPHLSYDRLLEAEPQATPAAVPPDAPLEIIFTSGTTSLPKGVVLTHANWLWSGERASHSYRIVEHDRLLTALPLFHVNAQSFTLLAAMTVGATAIFLETYSASRFVAQLRRHGATHTCLVAMLLRTLLAQPDRPDDQDHAVWRASYAINVPTADKEAFERRFGIELLNGYGLSEAMTEVSVCPVYGQKRWPSIGPPAFGREVRLVDAEGNEVPPGEVGEITVRGVPGRTIMKEYYKDPAATRQTIVDGWLHTGDNGYFDDAGYLYFFDRTKDLIKRAGENVSASEVEVVLVDHPAVAAAAVVGVPDPVRDEAVMAFIVPEAGQTLTEHDIIEHCRQHLAEFKIPTVMEFHDALPTTSIGKVEKKELRRMVQDAAAARHA